MHKGGLITYHDPFIAEVKTPGGYEFKSVELTKEALQNADCVVLTTNHQVFNAKLIIEYAKLIVDLRNVIKEDSAKIYKL